MQKGTAPRNHHDSARQLLHSTHRYRYRSAVHAWSHVSNALCSCCSSQCASLNRCAASVHLPRLCATANQNSKLGIAMVCALPLSTQLSVYALGLQVNPRASRLGIPVHLERLQESVRKPCSVLRCRARGRGILGLLPSGACYEAACNTVAAAQKLAVHPFQSARSPPRQYVPPEWHRTHAHHLEDEKVAQVPPADAQVLVKVCDGQLACG